MTRRPNRVPTPVESTSKKRTRGALFRLPKLLCSPNEELRWWSYLIHRTANTVFYTFGNGNRPFISSYEACMKPHKWMGGKYTQDGCSYRSYHSYGTQIPFHVRNVWCWCNDSLFDPINNSFFTPYYQNGLLFLFYSGWDTCHMIRKPALFRTDLMIHHATAFIITASSINKNALQVSHYMILECISLMNNTCRHNPRILKLDRTLCICFIRTLLTLWFYIHWEGSLTYASYSYMRVLYDMSIFFCG